MRRGITAKENVDGIRPGEIFAVNGKHLARLRVRFGHHRPRSGTVAFRHLRGAVGRKILHDAGEWGDRGGGYRERAGLGSALVIEEHGRDVEIISDLV